MGNNHAPPRSANVPDIALTADNVFVVSGGGSGGTFIGTSCAAPLLAGFMALVNQQAAISGKPSVGFITPKIYAWPRQQVTQIFFMMFKSEIIFAPKPDQLSGCLWL